MQRVINRIVQVDYTDKKSFEKDVPIMRKSGYILIENGMYGGYHDHGEIKGGDDDYKWKYTACYTKSYM